MLRLDMPSQPIAVVSTAASMLVMDAGMMGATVSYFWGFLLGRRRWGEQERRIAEPGGTAPTPPVADQDGERA